LDIFNKLDLNLVNARVLLPIVEKLESSLTEPTLEPSQKLLIGYQKVELS